MKWYINNEKTRGNLLVAITDMRIGEWGFHVEIKNGTRTLKQNASMWVYFRLVADALNDAGLEMHMEYLGKSIYVPWTDKMVHDRLWIPIQQSQFGTRSTTLLKRNEVSEVYEILSRWLSSSEGIFVPFPSNEPPMI